MTTFEFYEMHILKWGMNQTIVKAALPTNDDLGKTTMR